VPWVALDALGRVLTMLDLSNAFNNLIDWLAVHPRLAVDIGPWVLVATGLSSITAIHFESLQRFWIREKAPKNLVRNDTAHPAGGGSYKPEVQIIIGSEFPLDVLHWRPETGAVHTIAILIQNIGSRNITNCKVYIDRLQPNPTAYDTTESMY